MMDVSEIGEEDLDPTYKEFAKVIGLEAALKLGQEFGGQQFYFPKLDGAGGALSRIRNRKILEELKIHHGSIAALARKHRVTPAHVYELMKRERANQG